MTMALLDAPVRHRTETVREQNQRIELRARAHDALTFIVEARLLLAGIETTVAHTDPYALQRVVGLRRRLARYEETWR